MGSSCSSCGKPLPADQKFCGACGADQTSPVEPTMAATATSLPESSSLGGGVSQVSGEGGRFAPGTMVSERYRVIGMLGRGGMGEVYRADDLKLGRPVALKFLPEHVERDPHRLSRFLNEVRTALRVSHPNVCRVHDINEVGGKHYISMEYVDGEDLGTLLRRIGHFPSERAVAIARQLCAGLAAAHSEGIVHRDLKPANVMIDGRGQVKITDFGLSGLAGQFEGKEILAGTPSYMSPEQLAGKEVSKQSDIYSLGLVLYEVFTGKPAYGGATLDEIKRRRSTAPTSPASLVHEIDPAAERVILRCLEREPADRPGSALAVAAALPGGDPLADALAAGETPDPQLVAEAGAAGGLKPRNAVLLAVAMVVLLILTIAGSEKSVVTAVVDPPKPPAVLTEKAREILADLDYEEPAVDSLHTFEINWGYINHVRDDLQSTPGRWDRLQAGQPSAMHFAYRQAPVVLVFDSQGSVGNWVNRGLDSPVPGEIRMRLDLTGRLMRLEVDPGDRQAVEEDSAEQEDAAAGDGAAAELVETDWKGLLAAAGFDPAALTEVEPIWIPKHFSDTRRAWKGPYPEAPNIGVRIEASSLAGKIVDFRVIEPWTQPRQVPTRARGFVPTINLIINSGWFVVALVVGSFLAWRNLRLGRGDVRTALRFALVLAAVRLLWFVGAHHIPDQAEVSMLQAHLSWSMQRFGLAFIFYLALEPYARKLWPHMLTSWVRLFDRRFRDPLVGRDLLIGVAFGIAFTVTSRGSALILEAFNLSSPGLFSSNWTIEATRGFRGALTAVIGTPTMSILQVFVGIMMLFLFRLIFRRTWIMVLVFTVPLAATSFGSPGHVPTTVAAVLIAFGLFWFVFFRYGLLSVVLGFSVNALLQDIPLTFDLTAWWASGTWLVLLFCGAIAGWGFWASLAGRPVFKDEILADT